MSYILDALRKAERERNLGQPPSMQAVTQPSALHRPARRPLWPALLALAALLLIATLAALAWKYRRAANLPAAAEVPAQPAPAPAPAAAAALPGDAVSSFDDLAPPEPALPPAEEDLPGSPMAEPAAIEPRPAAGTPATAQAEPEAVEEPEAEEEAVLPLVRDMPPAWRASFPPLTVEVHVYDDNPAKRWVMVGSRRYREGEALAEGPRLAEITPDGIVFEHQGQRALLPIAR